MKKQTVVVIKQELMPGVPRERRLFVVDEVRKGIVYGYWKDTGDFDVFGEGDIDEWETQVVSPVSPSL